MGVAQLVERLPVEEKAAGAEPVTHPMELSHVVQELIAIFAQHRITGKDNDRYSVSQTVSTLAVLYEKARNAVEFRAEHLVRRAAIERILKRRILINGGAKNVAENLITELLWAKYIDTSLIDEQKIAEIQQTVERYLVIKHDLSGGSRASGVSWNTILGIASSEIDEAIIPAKRREALVNFLYASIRPKIALPELEPQHINMLAYIAVERAYAQSDDALIAFHLLKVIHPKWTQTSTVEVQNELPSILDTLSLVQRHLRDPLADSLYRYVRRQTAPYLLLRDFMFDAGEHARATIENPEKLEQKLSELANRRYQETGAKVSRAVVRSIIYIFLTKMLFAFALEAPYDLYVAKKLSYIPLGINLFFPPILLFLVAGLFSVPGADNTRRLIERIKKILYEFDDIAKEADVFSRKQATKRPLLAAVFSVVYLAMFGITFGLIRYGLTTLGFNVASQVIFVFFVALVSFFAYRIRQSAKEYEVIERQGILEPAVDFFFLPVLQAGNLLSRGIAKLNLFIFLFDFILEAPLKVIFEVAEEWIRFLRLKKEEII